MTRTEDAVAENWDSDPYLAFESHSASRVSWLLIISTTAGCLLNTLPSVRENYTPVIRVSCRTWRMFLFWEIRKKTTVTVFALKGICLVCFKSLQVQGSQAGCMWPGQSLVLIFMLAIVFPWLYLSQCACTPPKIWLCMCVDVCVSAHACGCVLVHDSGSDPACWLLSPYRLTYVRPDKISALSRFQFYFDSEPPRSHRNSMVERPYACSVQEKLKQSCRKATPKMLWQKLWTTVRSL